MRLTRIRHWAAISILALSTVFASTAFALETFRHKETKTFDVGVSPTIDLESISGDVSYIGTEGTTATVEIVIEIQADDAAEAHEIRSHLELIVEGESGFLEARMADSRKFYEWLRDEYSRKHYVTVGFNVTGPRGAEGTAISVSGNASVEDMAGPVEVSSVSGNASAIDIEKAVQANSVSGNVDVREVGGRVIAGSVSGDVMVVGCQSDLDMESTSGNASAKDVDGSLTVETVSGDIDARAVAGSIDAESVSGSIWVENREGMVRASTTSGDIDVRTRSTGDVDLESSSGSVDLAVDPDGFGSVYLSASSGDVESDLPIKVRRQSDGHIEGTLGTGTARLRVTTNSGDIVVNEL